MKEFAVKHRLRWKRDTCRDVNTLGKWGEIFRSGESMIGVQIGGSRADGSMTAVSPESNQRINRARRLWGEPTQGGDGEAVFVLPEDRLMEAARMIGAYRKRQLSPEHMARLIEVGRETRRIPALAGRSGGDKARSHRG